MSEYQYFEFVAIDRPLSDPEMADLRALSTRARISATSFVNTYHWGDSERRFRRRRDLPARARRAGRTARCSAGGRGFPTHRRRLGRRGGRVAAESEKAWARVARHIEGRKPTEYNAAAAILTDLQVISEEQGAAAEFDRRLASLRLEHVRKPTLQARLDAAGLIPGIPVTH